MEAIKKVYKVIPNKHVTTDSVCASVAYAYLQRHLYKNNSQVVLPQTPNAVTSYILQKFKIEQPPVVSNIFPKQSDVAKEQLIFLNEKDSLARALEIYSLYRTRMMPCVDDDKRCVGIISFYDLVNAFISPLDTSELNFVKTNANQVLQTLKGQSIGKSIDFDEPLKQFHIYNVSSTLEEFKKKFTGYSPEQYQKTIFVTANGNEPNQFIADQNPGLIVVCNNEANFIKNVVDLDSDDHYQASPELKYQDLKTESMVITTSKRVSEASILIKQSTPVYDFMNRETQVFLVGENTKLEDITRKFNEQKDLQGVVVVDKDGKLVNVVTRFDVALQKVINVTLVGTSDFNCLPGLQSAGVHIGAVISHHEVQKIETEEPIQYYCRNLACSSTIVSQIYEENGFVPPVDIAAVLLSGILVTSLLLQRRTTNEDARQVKFLSVVSGLNFEDLGVELINQIKPSHDYQNLINYDLRSIQVPLGTVKYFGFELGSYNFDDDYLIGLRKNMKQLREKGACCSFCMIVNIMTKQSLIIVEADAYVVQKFYEKNSHILKRQWIDSRQKILKWVFLAENMMSKKADFLPILKSTLEFIVQETQDLTEGLTEEQSYYATNKKNSSDESDIEDLIDEEVESKNQSAFALLE